MGPAPGLGATIWSFHPVEAPASAVWTQVGIGIWVLVVPRGTSSRLAGKSAVGWEIAVWVFGEAFGGIFAPGSSWPFGTPGAVLFYVAADALVALPERWRDSPRLGRGVLGVFGLYLAGLAVLQAWPGRSSWQGSLRDGAPGMLATMTVTMRTRWPPAPCSPLLTESLSRTSGSLAASARARRPAPSTPSSSQGGGGSPRLFRSVPGAGSRRWARHRTAGIRPRRVTLGSWASRRLEPLGGALFTASGRAGAFAVDGTVMTDWLLGPGASSWARGKASRVRILSGSSTN